ncbi:hypothetical protein LEMLEM_LOCUS9313 [Lemmus lemmus]
MKKFHLNLHLGSVLTQNPGKLRFQGRGHLTILEVKNYEEDPMGWTKRTRPKTPEALTWISKAPPKVVLSYTCIAHGHPPWPFDPCLFSVRQCPWRPQKSLASAGQQQAATDRGWPRGLQRFKPMLPGGRQLAGRQLALPHKTSIIFRQSRWLPTWCDFTGSGGPLPNPKIPPPPASFYSSL